MRLSGTVIVIREESLTDYTEMQCDMCIKESINGKSFHQMSLDQVNLKTYLINY